MILATAIKPSVERETLQLSGADTVRSPERLALHHEEEGSRSITKRRACAPSRRGGLALYHEEEGLRAITKRRACANGWSARLSAERRRRRRVRSPERLALDDEEEGSRSRRGRLARRGDGGSPAPIVESGLPC
jgi:hypothetical protein